MAAPASDVPSGLQPWELSGAQVAAAIASGRLTSEAVVRSCLERIAARDPLVKAWSWIDADHAIRQARELDKSPHRGPLHGVPIAVKDIIDTADLPTQYNSPIYLGHRPARDAAVVAILRAAGAVILGKTDTHEFAAAGRLPATRNPHDFARTPGGSSSGSAAAVADGQVPLALGTQTAGSVIRPASFCGTFALKPTWGTVSREGAKLYSLTLDTIGWFGRSPADLALLAEVLAIDPGRSVPTPAIGGLRIGVCRTALWPQADEATRDAVEAAAVRLARVGAAVTDIELPAPFAELPDAQTTIMHGEGRPAFLAEYRFAHPLLHQEFRDRVENARGISNAQLAAALDLAARLRPEWDAIAHQYDAVITPSAPGEAPASLTTTGDSLFNRMWTALHVPCVNVPAARGPHGMPVGVQLVGARYADATLLGVVATVAAALQV